ncbi:glycosyltransferase family 2 protein [Haloimpatiens sp. FM7330]|uniref:glycosyltransferase family 2 protein n=1 Tax=Haloimpatiens sp. FM7330 TaxID=3298610 RepID=UPI003637BDFC
MINQVLNYLFLFFQIIVGFFSMYYAIISVFGLYKKRERKNYKPEKRFALFVAAHNEEAVVGQIVDNLKEVDYPKDMYDIYVICDNCNDNTAKIVKEHGGNAWERFNDTKKGKGYALEWAFDRLFKMDEKYDGILMFDADNLVSKNFLKEMNNKLIKGYKVVQGYLDSKNPSDTWITASYAVAYWTVNRMFQLARYNLGMYSALGGTGICIEYNTLKEMGWGATSLTEDLEFTMRCLLRGIRPVWAHDCKVYDEKPLSFKASWKQRVRWLQGHWDVCMNYTGKLLKKGLKEFDINCIDGAIYLLQPSRIILNFFVMFMAFIQTFYPTGFGFIGYYVPAWFWYLGVFFSWGVPIIVLISEKIPLKNFISLIYLPLYGLTWIPISIIGFFRRNEKEWCHTVHNRTVSKSEMEMID